MLVIYAITQRKLLHALWNNRQPDGSAIRIFGSRAFIRDPTPSSKLKARSLEGVFVGRCINQNASRIFIPETRKLLISKYVKIVETILYRDMTKDLPILTVKIFKTIFLASCRHNIFFSLQQNELDIINDEHDSGTSIATSTVVDGHQDTTVPLTADDDNQGVDGTIPQDMVTDLPSPINSQDVPDDEQDFGSSLIPSVSIAHQDLATDHAIQEDAVIPNCEPVEVEDAIPRRNTEQTRQSSRKPKYSDKYRIYMESLAKQAILYDMPAEH
jgi:hypothetical protein